MKKHFATRPITEDDRLILESEVQERVPLHRSTIYRKVQNGTFPAPIRIAANRNAWRLSAILRWIAEREQHPIAARAYFGKTKAAPARGTGQHQEPHV